MRTRTLSLALATTFVATDAMAQTQPTTLPPVTVLAPSPGPQVVPVSANIDKFSLPQTVESVDQRKIQDTTNIVDVEDAIKYLPSIFVRKRNFGDTQPTFQTRMWGINSSARNLVYVDDVPISALISNNNTNGAPRWGLVSPEQIKGIDMLYGPFAAAYPGNSMGGVLQITTRQPEKLEITAKQTEAFQTFSMYKTTDTYSTSNSAATIGDKVGKLSFFLSVNREESFSQPLQFVTSATNIAAGGAIPQYNKTGGQANVAGAGGLLHTIMNNYMAKTSVDLTDWLRATYQVSYWENNQISSVKTYLTGTNGQPTFGGVAGFASNTSNWTQQHLTNMLSLKTDTGGNWDGEFIATRYDFLTDIQRTPAGVIAGNGTNYTTNGTFARLEGTGWGTEDAKAIWRPTGPKGEHEVSFGGHHDKYVLNNPTYNAPNWQAGPDYGNGTTLSVGLGKTETWALWLQDAWKITPDLKLTLGLRGDTWKAYGGYNQSGTASAFQPELSSSNLSPKATLSWQFQPEWNAKVSFGEANRYPTVAELYQAITTGVTVSIPNPTLRPETSLDFEIALERQDKHSRVRLSLFEQDTQNAILSQTVVLNNSFVTSFQNVDMVRNRGFELVGELKDVLIPGLTLSNSVTYVDSKIVSNPTFTSAAGTTSTGMRAPYIPDWRNTTQAIYRPNDDLSFSASARWQGKMYSTLDNSDLINSVNGAFDPFFVVDVHARYQFMNAVSAEVGVDNLTDFKYFEFHPFPGRTFIASLKARF